MPLWEDLSNIFSGGGRNDVNKGYKESEEYLQPYSQGGGQDFQKLRDYINSLQKGGESYQKDFNQLDQYGNAGDWEYKHSGMNPTDYYNEIMGGYNESPDAKYAKEQALKASGYGASASGMLGSGAFQKGIMEDANRISQGDRGNYFNNVMNTHQSQMQGLDRLQRQREMSRQGSMSANDNYGRNLWDLNNFRYRDANNRGDRAINRGNSNAKFDQSMFDDLMGLFGGGARALNSQGGKSGGGQNLPPYILAALGMG